MSAYVAPMFFKTPENGTSDDFWWSGAHLYKGDNARRELVARGKLTEMIWRAMEAAPQLRPTLTIVLDADGEILTHASWCALSRKAAFPVCI